MHSSKYAKARDYEGKKVVVVGACNSGMSTFSLRQIRFHLFGKSLGHDIARDLYENGVGMFLVVYFCSPW